MTENLKNIELRYQELEARLAANETYSDPDLVSKLNRAALRATWRTRKSCSATRK